MKTKRVEKAETSESVQIKYRITRIKDVSFFVEEEAASMEDPLRFNITQNSKVDFEKNEFELMLTFTLLNSQTDRVVISMTTVNGFQVLNLNSFRNVDIESTPLELPRDFIVTIFGLSYSHARAILSINLQGTKFDKLFLPVIDPNETADKIFLDLPSNKSAEQLNPNS